MPKITDVRIFGCPVRTIDIYIYRGSLYLFKIFCDPCAIEVGPPEIFWACPRLLLRSSKILVVVLDLGMPLPGRGAT